MKKKANLYSRFRRTQSKSYDRWRIVNLKKDHASTDRAKFFTPYFREKRPSFSASATLKTPPKERRSSRIFCDPDTIAELYFLRRVSARTFCICYHIREKSCHLITFLCYVIRGLTWKHRVGLFNILCLLNYCIWYGICDRTYYNCMCLQDVKIQRYKLYEKNYAYIRECYFVFFFRWKSISRNNLSRKNRLYMYLVNLVSPIYTLLYIKSSRLFFPFDGVTWFFRVGFFLRARKCYVSF